MLYIIYSTKKQKILFAFKDFLLFYKKFILCLQSVSSLKATFSNNYKGDDHEDWKS
ncbi:hypothetical protein CULT_2040008 [[Clostridium] ultunense Esp]|nr:hypothetical protein CULT_2040008 [[Clostridium] ultunense Esp]